MQRIKFIAPLLAVILAGCQSGNYNHYTSPEVTGRVLDADTHQPIANVRVYRPNANQAFEPFSPPKGGQLLIQPAPALTDADGHFLLNSKSVFALFRNPGWWTVPVTFQHSGYQTLRTNYTASNLITNISSGPPLLNTGEVLLQPMNK